MKKTAFVALRLVGFGQPRPSHHLCGDNHHICGDKLESVVSPRSSATAMATRSKCPGAAAISQESWSGPGRQGSTVVPANVSGKAPDLQGNLIFAERFQVESDSWWESHQQIALIVDCTDGSRLFRYRKTAQRVQILRVDPRDPARRQKMLNGALAMIRKTMAERDVLFHCRQSFHRAPVVGAAVHQRLAGVPATAHHYY